MKRCLRGSLPTFSPIIHFLEQNILDISVRQFQSWFLGLFQRIKNCLSCKLGSGSISCPSAGMKQCISQALIFFGALFLNSWMCCILKGPPGFNFWVPVGLTLIFLSPALMSWWNSLMLVRLDCDSLFCLAPSEENQTFAVCFGVFLLQENQVFQSKARDSWQGRAEHHQPVPPCCAMNINLSCLDGKSPPRNVLAPLLQSRECFILKSIVSFPRSQTPLLTLGWPRKFILIKVLV